MNDLVGFLLARIAEDEQRGRNCQDWSECGEEYGCPAHMIPERWAAECAAKRGLIHDAGDVPTISMRRALKWLALPYAYHEDFREEWRP